MLKLQLTTGQAVSEPWGHYTDGDISSGCRSPLAACPPPETRS